MEQHTAPKLAQSIHLFALSNFNHMPYLAISTIVLCDMCVCNWDDMTRPNLHPMLRVPNPE